MENHTRVADADDLILLPPVVFESKDPETGFYNTKRSLAVLLATLLTLGLDCLDFVLPLMDRKHEDWPPPVYTIGQ